MPETPSARPALVIFDLDGCLVDSEPLSLAALADEMAAVGASGIGMDELRRRFLGVSIRDIGREVGRIIGRPVPDDFEPAYHRRLFAAYARGVPQVPGIAALVDALQAAGIATAIGTGGSVERMRLTLDRAGLAARFEGTAFSADEVPLGKPAPDLFLHAARRLGLPAERCAVVEDSPHGIAAAVAAGMRPLGFLGGTHLEGMEDDHAARLRAAGAAVVAASAADLSAALLG